MTRQDIIDFVENNIPTSAQDMVKERLLALFDAGKDEETLQKIMATLKKLFNGQPLSDGDTEVYVDENLIEIFCNYYIPVTWREAMKAYMKDMVGDDESLEVRGMCDHLRGLFDSSMTEELNNKCDEYVLLWEIRKTLKEMLVVIEAAQDNPTVVPYEDMQSIYFNLQRAMNDTISRSVHSVGDIVIYIGKMRNTLNELRVTWKNIQQAGLTAETIKALQEIVKSGGLIKSVEDGTAPDGGTIRVMTDTWKEVKVGGFGKLSELTTTDKTSLVAAINEVATKGGAVKIKVWRTEAGLPDPAVWTTGEYCYNAIEKTLYKRTGASAFAVEVVTMREDATYIYGTQVYVYNGTELAPTGVDVIDGTSVVYNTAGEISVGKIALDNLDDDVEERFTDIEDALNELIAAGLTYTTTASPSVFFKNAAVNVTVKGTANKDMDSITIKKGDTQMVESLASATATATDTGVNDTATYTVVYKYKTVETTKTVTATAVLPIYYGSGTAYTDVTDEAHKYGTATTTPARTYAVNVAANGNKVFFVVPTSMTINKATLNGFDFPLEAAASVTVGGEAYKSYESSNTYDAGTINIVIS